MTTSMIAFNRSVSTSILAAAVGMAAAHASAATNLTWLDMSPVLIGNQVPNASSYFMPGLGNVMITYSIPSQFSHSRFTSPEFQNGNVAANTYQWTSHEAFAATNLGPSANGTMLDSWRITYTFPSTVPANQIYLGVSGLGRTSSFGGLESVATVNQNGTFLGDWISGQPYGATDFIPGAGTFSMRNSVIAPGGLNPNWNTELGVVQINDALNSLTIDFVQAQGDGLGVNIAFAVPAPASLSMLGLGALVCVRRRR
jgi:hypothetical protein